MSAGAALRGALRSCSAAAASSSRIAHRDLLGARLSPIALGKRPEVWTASQRRHLSWLPWKSSESDAAAKTESPFEAASTSTVSPSHPSPSLDSLRDSGSSSPGESSTPTLFSDSAHVSASTPSLEASSVPDPSSAAETVTHLNPGNTLSEVIASNSDLPLKEILSSPEAIQAQASTADLVSVGLGHSWYSIPGYATDLLVYFHSFTGLPWWANIIAVNIIIRLLLVQMLIPSIKHNARWSASMPEQVEIQKRVDIAKAKDDRQKMLVETMEIRKVWHNYDVSPLKLVRMPFVQMGAFFTLFLAIRSLAKAPWPQFLTGGFGWVQDLSVPDPYYILPATSLIFTMAVIRTGADMNARQATPSPDSMMKHMKNILTALCPLFIIGASQFPAAITLFWTVSNAYSLIQAHIIKTRTVKRWIGSEHFEGKPPPEPTMSESFDAVRDWLSGKRKDIDRQLERRGHIAGGAQRQGVETIIETPKRPRVAPPPRPKAISPPPNTKAPPRQR